MTQKHGLSVLITMVLMSFLTGCSMDLTHLFPQEEDVSDGFVKPELDKIQNSYAYRNTVAEQAWVQGLRKMRVRGFGIVTGLGTNGSSGCPRSIREQLIQEMYKWKVFSTHKPGMETPESIIEDESTAVVLIQGEIPAAAVEGTQFDLWIQAAPGTQTESLAGGRLWPAKLRIYSDTAGRSSVMGRVLADAEGPISWNPFATDKDSATRINLRRGQVYGGGKVSETRRIRLVLAEPSYSMSMRIANAINTRFPSGDVANAESNSYISLTLPEEYHDDPGHFLSLVRHVYLNNSSVFVSQRTQGLARELRDPSSPHAEIARAFEAIGKTTLPTIRKLYSDESSHVSFWSAVAGLRLGDDLAAEAVGVHAGMKGNPFRLMAIDELAKAPQGTRVVGVLRTFLEDPDPRIRVKAYEALLERNDMIIESYVVGLDNYVIDLVPSKQERIIYTKRAKDRRIALIGDNVDCIVPLFYRDDSVTISGDPEDKTITLLRRVPDSSVTSPPVRIHWGLVNMLSLIGGVPEENIYGQILGLGVSYSHVVRILQELSEMRMVNASFRMEQTTTLDLFGPVSKPGRQESEI